MKGWENQGQDVWNTDLPALLVFVLDLVLFSARTVDSKEGKVSKPQTKSKLLWLWIKIKVQLEEQHRSGRQGNYCDGL